MLRLTVLVTVLLCVPAAAQTVPVEWQTYAEKTNYRATGRYDEAVAFARKLDAASPLIRYTTYGTSGEGRPMPLLIAANGDASTPARAHQNGRVVVFIQAGIHAGEIDGKDAGFALLRDIAITKQHINLLDKAVILFAPIYNVDGHERVSPYNRINQNGPEEMGWRGNGSNMDLNRDATKADAPETRAWLKLWNEWNPDLFIDCHVTDGADFRYNVTWHFMRYEDISAPVRAWQKQWEERVVPETEKAGHLLAPYLEFIDNRDLPKGVAAFIAPPRYHTGYAPVRNRPGLLIETHMLKDYRRRVTGTYDVLRCTLAEVNRDPSALLSAVRLADESTISEGKTYDANRRYPLAYALTDKATPFQFKGVTSRVEDSEISGAKRVIWGSEPLDMTIPFYDTPRVTASASTPLYYFVPQQWAKVLEVLSLHGLQTKRLTQPLMLEVESFRLSEAKWPGGSFSGRVRVSYKAAPLRESRAFPAGTVVVPLNQRLGHVALHLLEPEAPDSLAAWGFFNLIFEQREYGEAYVLEKIAREMLAKDENLRAEFEQRLKSDAQFAANPRARLNFFFERSPYFDKQIGLYPVARVLLSLPPQLLK